LLALLLLIITLAAPAAASTLTVRGTVTDADGRPVPGADVTLFDGYRTEIMSVKTGSTGSFAFTDVSVDTSYFSIRAFYNDGRQTYTNAGYFTTQYEVKGNAVIPLADTRLENYRRPAPSVAQHGPGEHGRPDGAHRMHRISGSRHVPEAVTINSIKNLHGRRGAGMGDRAPPLIGSLWSNFPMNWPVKMAAAMRCMPLHSARVATGPVSIETPGPDALLQSTLWP